MNWRPWIILAALLAVVVVNTALMFFEEVAGPASEAEVVDKVRDDLATAPFTASKRRDNFKAFGLEGDWVDLADDHAQRVAAKKGRLGDYLQEYAEAVGGALCSGGLPQRYAALAFLVEQDVEELVVVDFNTVTYFEVQEWYDPSLVQDVYNTVELTSPKKERSTAMGVSALLLRQTDTLIEGRSPWGRGGMQSWNFNRVDAKFPELKKKLTHYFGFMHVLTEIANGPEGICGG